MTNKALKRPRKERGISRRRRRGRRTKKTRTFGGGKVTDVKRKCQKHHTYIPGTMEGQNTKREEEKLRRKMQRKLQKTQRKVDEKRWKAKAAIKRDHIRQKEALRKDDFRITDGWWLSESKTIQNNAKQQHHAGEKTFYDK